VVYRFGVFTFDDRAALLTRAGRSVGLEPQTARALALLLSRAADLVARDEIR
jgi:DNA-binding winged helix-turn-helix (wHTH) protein